MEKNVELKFVFLEPFYDCLVTYRDKLKECATSASRRIFAVSTLTDEDLEDITSTLSFIVSQYKNVSSFIEEYKKLRDEVSVN